jgi:hypothetical protein
VLLFCYAFAPLRYIVGTERLVIKRAVWSISVPYRNILSVELTEKVAILWWIVYLGSHGVPCYWGMFLATSEGDVGWVRVYATNLKHMVRIKTADGKTWYLSPADPEKFVAAVKEHLGEKER